MIVKIHSQALEYLIKTDKEFVTKLHRAYVDSLNDKLHQWRPIGELKLVVGPQPRPSSGWILSIQAILKTYEYFMQPDWCCERSIFSQPLLSCCVNGPKHLHVFGSVWHEATQTKFIITVKQAKYFMRRIHELEFTINIRPEELEMQRRDVFDRSISE